MLALGSACPSLLERSGHYCLPTLSPPRAAAAPACQPNSIYMVIRPVCVGMDGVVKVERGVLMDGRGWDGGDAHPPDSTVSLKPGLCAGGGRRCQRPSSKELRVIEGEEVQCSCGKAKRTGAFLWIPCVRGASEVGSSMAAGTGGVASPCAQIGGWGRSGSQRMTRYSSNSTRMDTRRPILLCSQPRKRYKHRRILESAAVTAAAAACQLEFVDKRWENGRTVGCEGSH